MNPALERPTVRVAVVADAPAVARLSGELGYPATMSEVGQRLASIAGDDRQQVVVGEVDGELVGWLEVAEALRVESGRFGEITGLVVAEGRRGSGIGRALVAAAADWCRDRGLGQLRVRTNVVRHDAQAFYAAIGFAPAKVQAVMVRAL